MLTEQELAAYLHFGYLPQLKEEMRSGAWAIAAEPHDSNEETLDEDQLIEQGVPLLKSAFKDLDNTTHIVPLSGGLDSRCILGVLLEAGLRDKITTVTFGTPGTLDYEIGGHLARLMNVRHETIDLTQITLEQSLLEQTIEQEGAWAFLFSTFYNHLVPKRFGKDATYWSGYMANTIAGSQLSPKVSHSWELSLRKFVENERYSESVELTPPNFHPQDVLPQSPILTSSWLTYHEQLHIAYRYLCCFKQALLPNGYDYRTPFLDQDWVNFILRIPQKYRKREYLSKKIRQQAYPELMALPSKKNFDPSLNAPEWKIWGSSPKTNYIDFEQGLRTREDFKSLVYENIQDLKRRKLLDWIDIDEIWESHQQNKVNHGNALILLTYLEINLKVSERSQTARLAKI